MASASTYAPRALGKTGKRLWRDCHLALQEGWGFDGRDLAWLSQACRTADLIASLERQLVADGLLFEGSQGQSRLHPAVAELRQQRDLLGRTLARLQLEPEPPRTGHLNSRQRVSLRIRQEAEARRAEAEVSRPRRMAAR